MQSGPWFVVQPRTGVVIPLSDEVYIVDAQVIGPEKIGIVEAAVQYGHVLDSAAAIRVTS